MYSKPGIESIRNNPTKVLAAIDDFGRTKKYLMNVGEDKGKIVADLIEKEKPKVMVGLAPYTSLALATDCLSPTTGRVWGLCRVFQHTLRRCSKSSRRTPILGAGKKP